MLISSIIVFLIYISTESRAIAQVTVEPEYVLVSEGEKVDLLCRYGRSIDYCRVEIPDGTVLNLSPMWNKTPGYSYYGSGLEGGQCGVSIERVKSINNGQVKCSLGFEGEELSGKIRLEVAVRPQQPIVESLSQTDREGFFVEGALFQARCSVRDGRPAANITWLLDENLANKRLSLLDISPSSTDNNSELFTSSQTIQWHLVPEDNGKKLICRSFHPSDRENVPPQEGAYILRVRYAPVKKDETLVYGLYLEHTAIVNMTIRSNPAPNVEWTVNGEVIRQGSENGRYSVYEPQYLGQDFYNVTLAIAGLTLEDTTKSYQMRASNSLGSTDYLVRISSSSKPPTAGLDIGAIVGIIVAVTILIIIILLVAFARTTGRWCFGGATLNTDIGPDSEAQINPDLNEELDGREFHNDVEIIDTTHQSEQSTPPVSDKLEAQKKADARNSDNRKSPISGTVASIATNGQQTEPKTNTSV